MGHYYNSSIQRALFFVCIVLLVSGKASALSAANVIATEWRQNAPVSSDFDQSPDMVYGLDTVPNISQIRFGSTGDPLNGLTLTWKGSGTADKISWGYTTVHEKGVFPGSGEI